VSAKPHDLEAEQGESVEQDVVASRDPLGDTERLLAALEPVQAARRATEGRRLWAATILSRELEACRSILSGRRVIAAKLDAEALRRARRGAELPAPDSYVAVTAEMLDAIAEAGPLVPRRAWSWSR
jgi:hypothetical protein